MAGPKILIDVEGIARQFKEFATEVEQDLTKGVSVLAASTHAWVATKAAEELHSEGSVFRDNLRYEEISPTVHVVTILDPAMWIEEGITPGTDMKEWFFKNKEKTHISAKGYRYRVMNFQHNKAPSKQNGYDKGLTDKIKFEMGKISREQVKQGGKPIPWGKIETEANGSPRIGKLHEFNFQGGRASSKWSTDPLSRVTIYQNEMKDKNGNNLKDAKGNNRVSRDIVTFRTASDNPKTKDGTGTPPKDKFIHPGYEAKKYLDQAYDQASRMWENEILPKILNKWK